MARDYWDFRPPLEDYRRIFEGVAEEFPPVVYKPDGSGSDGVTPTMHTRSNSVEIRPITPPDPPEFIRQWNERAMAEQPDCTQHANRKALVEAEAAEIDAKVED